MCNNRPSILVVEDDAYLVCTLTEYLKSLHFNVKHAYNGKDGIKKALRNRYQLAIIDLGLPQIDGFRIVEEIRKINNKPIIVITGSQEEKDELKAFNLKVNIFHTKPIRYEILGAQIKSLLNPCKKGNLVQSNDITIDTDSRVLKRGEYVIDLTKGEFDFILILVNSNGEVFSREQIIAYTKNCFNNPSKQCIDTMVSRIRKKLNQSPENSLIKTVNGAGYCINPEYLKNIKRLFS